MARMQIISNQLSSPRWAGDFFNREHLLPGGAQLDAAQFTADANGRKFVPSGTPVGRTVAERAAGAGFGPAEATDDDFYLTAFDVVDAAFSRDVELYRPGGIVKENFLPVFATLSQALKDKIRSLYQTTLGVN